ncbi:MAG TPA: transglycosylase SLT domain-containing protein [Thermomicrobiales bacterium]|nr:transglycosylase SLT domain-containing protein [Thermomicrobiales bacterium]
MAGSHVRRRTIAKTILAVDLVLVLVFPSASPVLAAQPTPTPESVRVPAQPAVDSGSSGANVRSRSDRQGSSKIPDAPTAIATATPDPATLRLNEPVLRWLPEIRAASTKWNVPPEILAAIIRIESQGEPGPISPAGARGLVQMMPDGLISHGVPESLWHDPATNIETGAWGLAWRFQNQGSWQGAVGAYLGFGCDIFGTCTDVYVKAVMSWADFYRPIIADPLASGIPVLPADWSYGPIRIFQMPNPPTPEPTPTRAATKTATPTATPKPGQPTSVPTATSLPTQTPKPGEPTSIPATVVPPTVVPPTEVPPTVVLPTDVPPTVIPPTDVPPTVAPPTEPPPPPTEPPPPPTEIPIPTQVPTV